jgi:hypothetical protein
MLGRFLVALNPSLSLSLVPGPTGTEPKVPFLLGVVVITESLSYSIRSRSD